MIRLPAGRRSRARGQALVEFALVVPMFFLLLFGLIDVGRLVYVNNAFSQAAREAARYGSVEQWQFTCPSSVPVGSQDRFTCTKAVAQARLVGYTFDAASSVTCTDSAGNNLSAGQCGANDILVVNLTTGTGANRFQFITPVIGQVVTAPTVSGLAKVAIQ
jgi:hypothetical protein